MGLPAVLVFAQRSNPRRPQVGSYASHGLLEAKRFWKVIADRSETRLDGNLGRISPCLLGVLSDCGHSAGGCLVGEEGESRTLCHRGAGGDLVVLGRDVGDSSVI